MRRVQADFYQEREVVQKHCSWFAPGRVSGRVKDCWDRQSADVCLKDFQRKVMRQRFCSEECRKGGSGAVKVWVTSFRNLASAWKRGL